MRFDAIEDFESHFKMKIVDLSMANVKVFTIVNVIECIGTFVLHIKVHRTDYIDYIHSNNIFKNKRFFDCIGMKPSDKNYDIKKEDLLGKKGYAMVDGGFIEYLILNLKGKKVTGVEPDDKEII